MNAAILKAAQDMGILVIHHVVDAKPELTLRAACIARGINPDATGYKVPSKAFRSIERLIPGVADSKSPNMSGIGSALKGNARKQYTRGAAATDLSLLEHARKVGEETTCYVAAFCRLNNLKGN